MSVSESEHGQDHQGVVHLPTPTAWPLVLSLGITLLLAGLLTHWVISLLGVVLIVPATVGWFRQVLPHEQPRSRAGRHEDGAYRVTARSTSSAFRSAKNIGRCCHMRPTR